MSAEPEFGVVSPVHASPVVEMPAMQRADEDDFSAKLRKLKSLLDEGILTQEEYETKKSAVLAGV